MSKVESLQHDSAEVQALVDAMEVSIGRTLSAEHNTPLISETIHSKLQELTRTLREWTATDALVKVSLYFFSAVKLNKYQNKLRVAIFWHLPMSFQCEMRYFR